ncbi:MAG: hypothetical protein AB1486_28740 [Planctomycetota bacterium]
MAFTGDIERDGCDDVMASAPMALGGRGKAYVRSGQMCGALSYRWEGQQAHPQWGLHWVSGAGDVNQVGWPGILVGAYLYDGTAGVHSGKACVFSGNDLYLQSDSRTVPRGTPITLHTRGGRPGVQAVLLLAGANGNQTYYHLSTSTLDANGE